MKRLPDFVGTWSLGEEDFFDIMGYGSFEMYIIEKRQIKEGAEFIKGIIKDYFGESTFEGELNSNTIRFTKKYNPEAIINGGHKDIIEYEAKEVDDKYLGEYTVINGTNGGIPQDWKHPFMMRKHFDPSMN